MEDQEMQSRREFLRYAMIGGIAVPITVSMGLLNTAEAKVFQFAEAPEHLTELERLHIPQVSLPPVVEDGSQASIQVQMEHPMEEDHYIRSIQIVNFSDPVQTKGTFYFSPANGQAFLGTQIRLNGGESTVWVVAECNQHGKWATSKFTKVAAGGC